MNAPNAAVLQQALILQNQSSFSRKIPAFWKAFFIVTLAVFSLIAAPRQGVVEAALTGGGLLQLVNADRVREGLPQLQTNLNLQQAAEAKARDILQNGYFAHTSPDGVAPWDFIKAAEYSYSFAGENLALNYTNSYELERDFLQSPEHRKNLLSPLYSETGIAVVSGTFRGEPAVITVQLFASPTSIVIARP